MIKLRENLDQLLKKKGWTAAHLSRVSGVPKTTIGEYLSGRKSVRNLMNLKKVADALEVTVDHLLFDSAAPGVNPSVLKVTSETAEASGEPWLPFGKFEVHVRRIPE